MAVKNTLLRYGGVAMLLHWLIAGLILTNVVLGFWFEEFLSRQDPGRFPLIQLHKSIGLTVLVLSVLRLAWRLMNPQPPIPWTNPQLRVLARATHVLLYFLMIAIPLAGYLMVSSSPLGNPTLYFGLFKVPYLPALSDMARSDKEIWSDAFKFTHNWLVYTTIGLLVFHVAGALYHHFLRRDDVLRRMLPGTKIMEPA